jgi:hypothetical protein
MQRANFALQGQLPVTEQQLGRLVEVSRRLARATGRDAAEAFERHTNGIVKGEQNVLEELGLFTRLTDTLKAYEKQTGKNSDALSQQQKILLFYNAVVAEAEQKVAALGEENLTAGERVGQMRAAITNYKNAILVAIAESPKLTGLLESLGTSAEDSAKKIQDLANKIGALVDTVLGSPVASALFGVAKFEAKVFGKAAGASLGIGGDDFERNLRLREAKQELEAAKQELARQRAIEAKQKVGPLPPEPVDPATLSKRIALQEQLARDLAQLTSTATDEALLAIAKLEKEWVAAFGRIDAGTRASLDRIKASIEASGTLEGFRSQLDDLAARSTDDTAVIGRNMTALGELLATVGDEASKLEEGSKVREQYNALLDQGAKLMRQLGQAAKTAAKEEKAAFTESAKTAADSLVRPLQDELTRRRTALREALVGGLVDKKEFEKQGEEAARAFNGGLLRIIKQLRDEGRDDIADLLSTELEINAAGDDRLVQLTKQAALIEQSVRAAEDLAAAFGLADSNAANILRAVSQLAAAVPGIAQGDPASIVAAISANVQITRALLGSDPERQARIDRNTAALERLRQAYEGTLVTGGPLDRVSAGLAAAQEGGAREKLGATGSGSGALAVIGNIVKNPALVLAGIFGKTQAEKDVREGGAEVLKALKAQGISFEELKRLADELGVELFDKKGRITAEGFDALVEAVKIAQENLLKFAETADGLREKLDFEARIFDQEQTPESAIQRELDIIAKKAPELFEKFFAAGDASTPEGRAQLEEQSRALARAILEGVLDVSLLGTLTGDEIKDILLRMDSSLDDINSNIDEGAAGGPESTGFRVVRTITETTGERMAGYLSTIAIASVQSTRLEAGILSALGGRLPTVALPTTEAFGPRTLNIDQGKAGGPPITFQVSQSIALADADPVAARAAGEALGDGMFRAFDRRMGDYNRQRRSAQGVR